MSSTDESGRMSASSASRTNLDSCACQIIRRFPNRRTIYQVLRVEHQAVEFHAQIDWGLGQMGWWFCLRTQPGGYGLVSQLSCRRIPDMDHPSEFAIEKLLPTKSPLDLSARRFRNAVLPQQHDR